MKFSNKFLSLTAVISALLLSSCSAKANTNQAYLPEAENHTIYTTVGLNDELRVSFIDVGQGDSEFIEPVSYTHLDVYKRQAVYPAPNPLSIFTTTTPLAQLLSIHRSDDSPLKLAP